MTRTARRSSRDGSGGRKRLDVFDFTEDDERVEKDSRKFLGKFEDSRGEASCAVDKYIFLSCFVRDTTPQRNKSIGRVIDVEDETSQETKTPEVGLGVNLSDTSSCIIGQQFTRSMSNPISVSSEEDAYKEEISGLATHSQSTVLNFEREPINVIPDVYCGRVEMSSSPSTSSLADNEVSLVEEALRCGFCGHEIDAINMNVVVFPDFIIYGDIYCTEARVTFSCSCIRVECSSVNATKENFSHCWAIEDIISIESDWCLKVETAFVNLILKSRDSKASNANKASGFSLLKFAVCDPKWSEALEAIKLLDSRYKDIWNIIFEESGEKTRGAHYSRPVCSKYNLSQGDPDAVSVSKRDVEVLQPASFINDTVIDFYIKYLSNQVQPKEKKRFHFFNSFFFQKLVNLDKGPSRTSEGREAFQRVRKWTKKVDLFGKDYIFIPVNYSLHWSLIVICHPGEAVHFKDEEAEKSPRVPCILHMDSIKGSHRGLKNLFQGYLCEEWKERNGAKTDDVPSKLLNLRFLSLELPQQENSFDCGLFLLHYVELFLAEAPASFSPFNISKSSTFLSRNWFLPAEASLKRGCILKLLYSLAENRTQDIPSADCSGRQLSSRATDKNGQETKIEILTESCSSRKPHDGNSTAPAALQTEPLLSAAFSPRGFLEPAVSSKIYCRVAALPKRDIMSPIEEVGESSEKIPVSLSDARDHQQITEMADAFQKTVFSCEDSRQVESSWNRQCTLHIEESDEEDLVLITSVHESQKSPDVQLNESSLLPESTERDQAKEAGKLESSSILVEELNNFVVEDSLEMDDNKDSEDSASSSGNIIILSYEKGDSNKGYKTEEKDVVVIDQDLVSETTENRMAKRRKTCPS